MFRSIEGLYSKGHIELAEKPPNVRDNTPVIVTFLTKPRAVDLRERGITKEQAAEARARFATFAEDWDSPEMSIYDDYWSERKRRQALS